MNKYLAMLYVVLVMVAHLIGCVEEEPPTKPTETESPQSEVSEAKLYVIMIDSTEEVPFKVTLPDGTVYTDSEIYQNEMPSILKETVEAGYEIHFGVSPAIAAEFDAVFVDETTSDTKDGFQEMQQPLEVNRSFLGGYYFSASFRSSKWVGGCVSKTCSPGFAVRLHRDRTQLWDMHGGKYTSNGRTCFGLYESESKWCRNWCSPTLEEVRNALYAAAMFVGVVATTAWAIAQALAPLLIFAV